MYRASNKKSSGLNGQLCVTVTLLESFEYDNTQLMISKLLIPCSSSFEIPPQFFPRLSSAAIWAVPCLCPCPLPFPFSGWSSGLLQLTLLTSSTHYNCSLKCNVPVAPHLLIRNHRFVLIHPVLIIFCPFFRFSTWMCRYLQPLMAQ